MDIVAMSMILSLLERANLVKDGLNEWIFKRSCRDLLFTLGTKVNREFMQSYGQ